LGLYPSRSISLGYATENAQPSMTSL